ncbi:Meiosis-specific serine/threonine-protein kinase mek1 [Gamsiella multidivaricata]|nr:Meiosis-specific serine/threonine-protein kinase mek1 [Gamsiella multidivaricata]
MCEGMDHSLGRASLLFYHMETLFASEATTELTPPKLEHEDVEIGAQLAVKIMDRIRYGVPEYSGGTDIEKEVTILRTVDHANIVPVVDTIKTTRYIYIFMQMVTGGDLFDYIVKNGPLSELEAKFVAYQTLLALQYLHNINISHRDLKPENLLLTSTTKYPRVLLTDFGMARQFEQGRLMNTMCGTFAYMAPEVFDVKHAKGSGYGYTADCWSLGVTLYVVLSGGSDTFNAFVKVVWYSHRATGRVSVPKRDN